MMAEQDRLKRERWAQYQRQLANPKVAPIAVPPQAGVVLGQDRIPQTQTTITTRVAPGVYKSTSPEETTITRRLGPGVWKTSTTKRVIRRTSK
jgi:hypothetical protein